MEPFQHLESVAMPLLRDNIDTDIIIPSREIRSVTKRGLADGLFAGWRYIDVDRRIPDPSFVLNDTRYRAAAILLAGANFGCGSSREHAVWALVEFGFRAIIAPSFGPIFRANCIRNGILPVTLAPEPIANAHVPVRIDLLAMTVSAGADIWPFALDAEDRNMLLNGLDAIDLTMLHTEKIEAFRIADRKRRPWAYRQNSDGLG